MTLAHPLSPFWGVNTPHKRPSRFLRLPLRFLGDPVGRPAQHKLFIARQDRVQHIDHGVQGARVNRLGVVP